MKAQKENKRLQICLIAGLLLASYHIHAQSFSAGKNLHDLRKAALLNSDPLRLVEGSTTPNPRWESRNFKLINKKEDQPVSPVFLPRWSAECLPFFCRIEHKFAKNSAVPVKFRLGSVEYVDWLEGKTRFPTFAPQ